MRTLTPSLSRDDDFIHMPKTINTSQEYIIADNNKYLPIKATQLCASNFSSFAGIIDIDSGSIYEDFLNRIEKYKYESSSVVTIFDSKINEELIENHRRLDVISSYKNGWDGYDADSFDLNIIEKARNIIKSLDYQPALYPTGRSTIQIEYEINNDYLEFEIYLNKITTYHEKDDKLVNSGLVAFSEIRDLVNKYYENK